MVDEREKDYQHMMEWCKFLRRHNANIFDVVFSDVDHKISEETLYDIIRSTAEFFELPLPHVKNQCDKLAQVKLGNGRFAHEFQLEYNLALLKQAGANNVDTLTLCLTHELCHEYFKNNVFMLCRSERWAHELASDYICGIRSCLMNLATGKYKYIVSKMPATITHPPGDIRAKIVDYAREFNLRISQKENRSVTFQTAMEGFPIFVYQHARYLNNRLREAIRRETEPIHFQQLSEEPTIDTSKMSDTNLIKKYVINQHK